MNQERLNTTPEEVASIAVNREILKNPDVKREYPDNFDRALEVMTAEFIAEQFDAAQQVIMAETKDDLGKHTYHQHGFDLAIQWENGVWTAMDVSDTHSPEEEFKKMKRMRDLDETLDFTGKRPLVDIHTRDGKVLAKQVPHATVLYGPKAEAEWKKAYAVWVENGQRGMVADWLEDQLAVKINIIADLYRSFEYEAENFPQYRSQFKPVRDILEAQIKKLMEEAESRPDSRREIYDLVRHRELRQGSKKPQRGIVGGL
ncbi:MAG: hypothetical protein HYT39_02140 [Candidatus Sungbacteria bacterium]|nr:hypothetical protein [Candidatus Sungbacteria bacterium]